MKNLAWKPIFGFIFGAAVAAILVNLFFSCQKNEGINGDQITKEVKNLVKEMKANLPQQSPVGMLTAAEFSDNTASFTIEVDEFLSPMMDSVASLDDRLTAINVVSPIVANVNSDDRGNLAKAFKESGVEFCYIYISDDNSKRKEVKVENVTLIEAIENLVNPDSPSFFSDDFYRSYFSTGKSMLPLQLDDLTTWVDVKGVPGGVEYVYSLEGVTPEDMTPEVVEQIRRTLVTNLSADIFAKAVRLQMTKTPLTFTTVIFRTRETN